MKKFSFIISTLGGAVLGYLASNQRLREELTKAKGPNATRKILAGHLQKDGKRIGQDIRSFLESAHVQKKIRGAQTLLQQQWQKAEGEIHHLFDKGKHEAEKFSRKTLRSARSSVKRVKRLSKIP
ncbi:hypothetical protein A3H22_04065 [Candidatus Peribacteria bacterium RIFCSPLOWO2_12_FULL_55_15]|nr:MAG: hypothetical protein A2789_03850 [Candidatus Peribacteria bacterium RIFCSPHIGHO2_01_FULL_54_22]OGJ63189.1 MAG: hypothetical protein A3D12_03520 [Candidatus Peribacteria bacterium RIFCSPHIGHO2_02_FULL_55_24]OGJ64188.1 MAG: hypothetical protein A3E47_03920 [Candidatus Peribacteria bacterium RIFCSPHIGHO2_12_FULL_54_10]OGJ68538.1 MAG: hypothetical protein A2947_01360 [Candidatus Peribacteria bacterium RIFCSPLOWO2_01_FULL_54_110]OGJ69148.1 MAG: hypothetical protein A3H90_01085 [Candidatus Pe